jgi:sulfur dioxygenase
MTVEALGQGACKSYLLGCDRSREALLVDPLEDDLDATLARLDREGWRVRGVVDTHTHADHPSGAAEASRRLGVPYLLHAASRCAFPHETLHDGQRIPVGDLEVEVLHTPGHTEDSVSLRAGRDLLTGDFLFLGAEGAGRLDLPGGDAGAHWDSLRKLAALPDATRVLPGHDYHGMTASTLAEERRRNPRFQSVTREEYRAWQKAVRMDAPRWMLDVLARNLGTAASHEAHHAAGGGGAARGGAAAALATAVGAPAPGAPAAGEACSGAGACASIPTGRVPLVAPAEAHRRRTAAPGPAPLLLDVREPFEFHGPSGRHAAGAVLVPLASLPASRDRLPAAKDAEVLVICKTGGRSAKAAEWLIDQGYRRVFSVAGGTDRWAGEGLPVER